MRESVLSKENLTQRSILRGMLFFAMPIIFGTLCQQLYNAADSVIVGRALGKTALAAVGGSSARIVNLNINFLVGLSSGTAVIVSQFYGAKDSPRLRMSIFTGVVMAVVSGFIMMLSGILTEHGLLVLMKTTPDTIELSSTYLRICFLGLIPMMLYNMGSGILRAMGDSKRPLYYLMICVAANIGLDLLFVLVFHWGICGAAAATASSQVICAALVIRALTRLPEEYRLTLKWDDFDLRELRHMLQIGVAAGLQSAMYNLSNIILQSAINLLGTDSVAGWTAFLRIDEFYWPISGAIGMAVMTFVGQSYGAGRIGDMRQSIRMGMLLHVTASVFVSLFIFVLRYPAIGLFVKNEPNVVQIGVSLTVISLFYAAYSPAEVYSSAMRGVGDALIPTGITVLFVCVVRIIYLVLYGFEHASNMVLALIYPVTWASASFAFMLYYRFGHWFPRKGKI